MAMTYEQFLRTFRRPRTAESARVWLAGGFAPLGTPIPARLRPYFGGAAVLAPGTPNADVPPAPPAPPPAPLPAPYDPTDPVQEAAINNILTSIRTLPALYNPRRQALAATTAANLVGEGFADVATPVATEAPIDATIPADQRPTAPNVSYRIELGPDGRLYRQAYAQILSGAAQRGAVYGSQTEADIGGAQQSLNAARNAVLTNYGTEAAGLFTEQSGAGSELAGNLTEARGNYADWKVQQPAPSAVAPPAPAPAAPARPAPVAVPKPPQALSRPLQLVRNEMVRMATPKPTLQTLLMPRIPRPVKPRRRQTSFV